MNKPMLIYVAGPLTTSGLAWHNIRNACLVADYIRRCGHHPLIPHLSTVWAQTTEQAAAMSEDDWIEYCLFLLERCDALFRLPGQSRGGDMEVDRACALGIPVYLTRDAIPVYRIPSQY